jgi:uncharacterized protein (TIGR02246 family)
MTSTQVQSETLAADYTAAWNTGSPDAVASFYAEDGMITINKGDPWIDRAGVSEMASGFFADIPNLRLVCDSVRAAGDHIVYQWTFTGTHAQSGRKVEVSGWEEWDINEDGQIHASLGWFDGEDYTRQTEVG